MVQLGAAPSDEEIARAVERARGEPLGTAANPVRVSGVEGEHAYIAPAALRRRQPPRVGQRHNVGVGVFGSIVDVWPLDCGDAAPGRFDLALDMYHDNHEETQAPAGFIARSRALALARTIACGRSLKWLGTVLLFALVALSFAPTLVPPFLDRIYYRGPGQRPFRRAPLLQSGRARSAAARSEPVPQPLGAGRARRLARTASRSARPCRRAGSWAPRCGSPGSAMPPCWCRRRASTSSPTRSGRTAPRLSPSSARPGSAQPGVRFEDLPRDRPRPRQPQSLRPYGPADAPAPLGARPAADRHQPRQRHDPARRGGGVGGSRLGRAGLRTPRHRGDRRAQPSLGLALGHGPQPRALVGLHDRDARRQHLLRRRHRLGRRQLGARGGARTGRSGSPSSRSAPICRATSCRTAISAPPRRCASSQA